jgi:UDP-N-acetylmuramyl tripeptide synthase
MEGIDSAYAHAEARKISFFLTRANMGNRISDQLSRQRQARAKLRRKVDLIEEDWRDCDPEDREQMRQELATALDQVETEIRASNVDEFAQAEQIVSANRCFVVRGHAYANCIRHRSAVSRFSGRATVRKCYGRTRTPLPCFPGLRQESGCATGTLGFR